MCAVAIVVDSFNSHLQSVLHVLVENAFHDSPDVVYQVADDDLIARRQNSEERKKKEIKNLQNHQNFIQMQNSQNPVNSLLENGATNVITAIENDQTITSQQQINQANETVSLPPQNKTLVFQNTPLVSQTPNNNFNSSTQQNSDNLAEIVENKESLDTIPPPAQPPFPPALPQILQNAPNVSVYDPDAQESINEAELLSRPESSFYSSKTEDNDNNNLDKRYSGETNESQYPGQTYEVSNNPYR